MKSTGIIYQDFSIVGLKKQWEWQNSELQKEVKANGSHIIGCKTETRRLTGLKEINKNPNEWMLYDFQEVDENGEIRFQKMDGMKILDRKTVRCPYGVKGDELWVKTSELSFEEREAMLTPAQRMSIPWTQFPEVEIHGEYFDKMDIYLDKFNIPKKRNPLFMPKASSRITLEITGISVERLHDITEEGALREGVTEKWNEIITFPELDNKQIKTETYAAGYAKKWAELHGQESWNLNPWLWVIQFKVKSII